MLSSKRASSWRRPSVAMTSDIFASSFTVAVSWLLGMSSALSSPSSRQAPLIAVDARLWGRSGIGRYCRELLPRVMAVWPEARWRLYGKSDELCILPEVEKLPWDLPVYSWREHFPGGEPAGWHEADLRWVPHYNVTAGSMAPLVATVHDVLPLVEHAGWRGRLRSVVAGRYFQRVRRVAGRVLCPSRFSGEGLASIAHVTSDRIRVTPLAAAFLRPAVSDLPREPVWLFVGNVKPHKGLSTVLAALSRDEVAATGRRLVVVGRRDGFFTGSPELARASGRLGERVQWAGEVDDVTLGRWYARAEALIMPSRHEGFGLPVLEAMTAGCPVVAARAGSLPEVAGEAALWFEPGDADELARRLVDLANDERLRTQLASSGRCRSAQFDWEITARLTVSALREALEGPR
ncbi:MAG: glycosyltransferase family 1 protein [Verrucomicrobiota bacterium]